MAKRHLPQWLHILIASAIFLSILTLIYLIVGRHNQRLDLTRDKIYSVSQEMLAVLKRMQDSPITVRAFFAEEDPLRRDYKIFLKEAATHHPAFHFEFYDPDRSPSVAKRYGVEAYRTVKIEYQERQDQIQDPSEEAFANALIRLAHPKKQTLCFTKGHGENELESDERNGLLLFKQLLESHHYEIKEVQIAADEISEDCGALVMAGPRYELLPQEVELLQKFASQGKGFLLLIDPMDLGTGKSFRELVKPMGVTLADDVVVDKASRILGGDFLVPFVAQYASHPITQKFQAAVYMPVVRSVKKISNLSNELEVTELAKTLPGSWAETDLQKLENAEAELDPSTDNLGPVSLAAAIEAKGTRGWRAVVVGDSDFLNNAHLKIAGNQDFALNILEWLFKDDRWISIHAKQVRFQPLFLKVNQSVTIASFAIGILPLTTLVAGSAGIWTRRRKSY